MSSLVVAVSLLLLPSTYPALGIPPRAFSYPVPQLPSWHHLIPHLHLIDKPTITDALERIDLGLVRDPVNGRNPGMQPNGGGILTHPLLDDLPTEVLVADVRERRLHSRSRLCGAQDFSTPAWVIPFVPETPWPGVTCMDCWALYQRPAHASTATA